MKYIRWYDKDSRIQAVFEFIQGLEAPAQNEIARDIIQILTNELKAIINLDEMLNKISKCDYKNNRWYDNNEKLFTSFEIIKNLPEELQIEVTKRIIESALLMYFGRNKND